MFLHLSKDEQRKRFLERIDEPEKNWKFSLSDIHERKYWKHYMEVYEDCLSATSTHHAPWYVVPADDKENARLIVSRLVLDALEDLKMAYPKTTQKRRLELEAIGKQLMKSSSQSKSFKRAELHRAQRREASLWTSCIQYGA